MPLWCLSYGLSKDPMRCDKRYCQESRLLKKTLTIYHEGPTLDLSFYYDSSFKWGQNSKPIESRILIFTLLPVMRFQKEFLNFQKTAKLKDKSSAK